MRQADMSIGFPRLRGLIDKIFLNHLKLPSVKFKTNIAWQ